MTEHLEGSPKGGNANLSKGREEEDHKRKVLSYQEQKEWIQWLYTGTQRETLYYHMKKEYWIAAAQDYELTMGL
jgi:hypothetical protein